MGQTPATGDDPSAAEHDGSVGPGVCGGGWGAGDPATHTQELPLLHAPWKLDGQLSLQEIPQPPQLYASVRMFTHWLSHAFLAPPLPLQGTHAPPVQMLSSVQTFPHAPQWLGSFCRS